MYQDKEIFYIDTDPKVFKFGIKLKPLIISEDKVLIGVNGKKFGFVNYLLDPKVITKIAAPMLGGAVGNQLTKNNLTGDYQTQPELSPEDFQQINFRDIQNISNRKLWTGDNVIDLEYMDGTLCKKLSFFAVNKYNTLNEKTMAIYNILVSKKTQPVG